MENVTNESSLEYTVALTDVQTDYLIPCPCTQGNDLHAMGGISPDVIVTEELPIKLADVPLL